MRGTGRMVGVVAGLSVCLALGAGSAVGQERGPSGPSPAVSESDPSFRQGAERERAERARMGGREAREERTRSRSRFRGLSRGEALGLARAEFPEILRDRLPDGRRPAAGLEVVDQFGKGAALVEDDRGERSLLRSSGPLQVPGPGGGFVPLDMSLEAAGEGFSPAASGAPLVIGGRVGDGVEFTEGDFSVAYKGREGAEVIRSDDRVFAGEVATDTDLVLAPRPQGVEVAWSLRSPSAPQSFTLKVDLPRGGVLRRARSEKPIPGDPPEAVEIARGDEVLGYVYAPLAYDADGTPVASRADIDGDRIVVRVDHRDQDLRFPVLVDPEVIQPNDYYTWGWAGWRFTNMASYVRQGTSASDPGTNFFGAALNDPAYAYGMYESMPTHTWYESGVYAHWLYQAPANTYVYRATLGAMRHTPYVYAGHTYSRSFHGLMNNAYTAWESPVNYVNQSGGVGPNPFGPASIAFSNVTHDFCFTTRCDRTKGSQSNLALFALQAANPVNTNGIYTDRSKATMTMSAANIYLGDRHVPTITAAPASTSQWVDDNAGSHQATITAADVGLGVKTHTLSGSSSGTLTRTQSCTGDIYRRPCPANRSETFSYTLPEGITTLTARARDIVDNQSAARTWTKRIDRSAPSSVTLSGPLRDRDGKGVSGPSTLRAVAADRWSGVRKLQMLVDDRDVEATMAGRQVLTQGDPGTGGGMSGDLDFNPSSLASGRHEIRVVATDGVGRTRSSETIEVIVDRTKPQLTDVSGSLRRPFVNGAVHDLNVEAQDPTSDGVSSGMERIEIFVRDPDGSESSAHTASSAGAPSLSTTFPFDATGDGYAQGRNRVRVTARDQAANQADEVAFPVVVDREGPNMTLSGSLADQDGQTIPEGQYTLDIDASDGAAGTNDATQRSGVTQVDVIVNDELHDSYQAPCPEGNCSVRRSVPFNTEDFPGGQQDIVVVAMDGLGNETSDTLTVTTPCCLDDSYLAGFTSPLDHVAYGDVNGDSRSDVVAASPAGTLTVALSDGQVFGIAQPWGTIPAGAPLLVGDVNDDGNADVVTRVAALDPADPDRQLVQVHLSDGRQFGPPATWGEWRADADLRLADLDGDGLQDLIGRDRATGSFRKGYSLGSTFDIADAGVSIAPDLQWDSADPDGDTDADLISRDPATGQINVLASDSGLHSLTPTQWATAPGNVEILFADMDGNNADDLVIRQPDTGRLDVGASDRETFATPVQWGNVANSASTLALADIGGDGKHDALTRNTVLGTITASRSDSVTPIHEADPYLQDPTLQYDNTDGLTLDLPGLRTQSTGDGAPFTKIAWGSPEALVGKRGGVPGARTFTAAPEDQYNRSMWRMKQAGANVVRVVVYWGDYLNIPSYREALDLAVDRFEADNMVVYMTLTGADFDEPVDGQPTHLNPDPADFADFVTDVANRYKDDGVRRFGIWNEPNLPSGTFLARSPCPVGPDEKPRRLTTAFLYRELYEAGYDAAKAANASARIHIGELSEQRDVGRESCSGREPRGLDTDEWLDKAVGNEDIRTHGVAWHPYQHATDPRDKDKSVMGIGRIAEFKKSIDALHESGNLSTPDGKVPRTYLTEFGYFARPQSRSSDEREWHSERTRGIWSARAISLARRDPNNPAMFGFWIVPEAPPVEKDEDKLNAPENVPSFDTGVIHPDTGAVTGMKDYGKGDLERQAYCRIWWYARNNNYPQIGPQPGQPDQCG